MTKCADRRIGLPWKSRTYIEQVIPEKTKSETSAGVCHDKANLINFGSHTHNSHLSTRIKYRKHIKFWSSRPREAITSYNRGCTRKRPSSKPECTTHETGQPFHMPPRHGPMTWTAHLGPTSGTAEKLWGGTAVPTEPRPQTARAARRLPDLCQKKNRCGDASGITVLHSQPEHAAATKSRPPRPSRSEKL